MSNTTTKTVASFDLGLHTGWAITTSAITHVASGVTHHKGKNWESRGIAYLRAGRFFRDTLTQYKPDLCSYEAVKRFMSSDASLTYGAILGQLLAVCEDLGVPTIGYSPTEVKKTTTGSGRASKDEMIAAALRIYGVECKDDNQADALCIGYTTHHLLLGT